MSQAVPLTEPKSFEDQLVQLLSSQPRRMFLPLFLALVGIAGLAARTAPMVWVCAWFALATSMMLVRIFVQSPHRLTWMPARQKLRLSIVLVALSGATHALSLLFFLRMPPFEQAVLSMMLVGLTAGSVATAAGYRPLFLAYLIPTMGPVVALWLLSPGLRDLGWIKGLMAILFVLFGLVLNALARDVFRILRESFDIRQERSVLNRELQSALEAAEAANRAKTRFLASASHDLRQPMQTLSLFAAALAMRQLDDRSREIAVNINEALQDLTAELDALLDVSKLDAGTILPNNEPFAMRPLVTRVSELFGPMAADKDLELRFSCGNEYWGYTDRKLLERLLRNLVENAIKYTDEGSVEISVESFEPGLRVSVIDTGCGIEVAEQERIFEEFYQVSNPGRDRRRGLGLGLAIVRRLSDLLGLRLELHSEPGKGTRFTLYLPEAVRPDSREIECGGRRADFPSRLRVLLVDDEEGIRKGMGALLEEAGLEVRTAADSASALSLGNVWIADVLIADFRLGDNDNGIETIRQMRELHPPIHAILMTGETAPDRLREAQDAQITVLHKPVPPHLLLSEIRRVITQDSGA